MSTRTQYICDHCGGECSGKFEFSLFGKWARKDAQYIPDNVHGCTRDHAILAVAKILGIGVDGSARELLEEQRAELKNTQFKLQKLENANEVNLAQIESLTKQRDEERGFGVARHPEPTDDLVEKLAHAIQEGYEGGWEYSTEQNKKLARKDAKSVLAELAKMPCELPTDDSFAEKLADSWVRADGGENAKEDEILATRRALQFAQGKLAPVLAAKDAEIAGLERDRRQCKEHIFDSGLVPPGRTLNEAIGEILRQHKIGRKRIAELDASNAQLSLDAASFLKRAEDAEKALQETEAERSALKLAREQAEARTRAWEARTGESGASGPRMVGAKLTPIDADGKTPGQLFGNVFEAAYKEHERLGCSEFACIQIGREQGAKAVLRAFGNGAETLREALERVRNAVIGVERMSNDTAYGKQWAHVSDLLAIIDDELAKLGQVKPTSDHVQTPKKYDRDWLMKQTDDALFDLYMQHVGFFDMNGAMTQRENMIETLASVEDSLTDPQKPTKPVL